MFVLSSFRVSLCYADLWVSLSTDKAVSGLVVVFGVVGCDSAPVREEAVLEQSGG